MRGFYRVWTRKESFVKALGDGLSCPLSAFDMSVDETSNSALLGCDLAGVDMSNWTTVPIATAPGYAAALTVSGLGWRLVEWGAVAHG